MPWWLVAAIVILTPATAAGDARSTDQVAVFQCQFDAEWDVNYDRWPDHWVRKTGHQYPHYVTIEIQEDPTALAGRCLRIDLDGASAHVFSPPIHVMSRFSYALQARVKAEELTHGAAFLTLEFFDRSGQLLQSVRSDPISTTGGWKEVRLLPVEPNDPAVDRAVIGLEVRRGSKADLDARVSLDDVRLDRLPRINVSTDNPFNLYADANEVVVKCELSGIMERDPEIRFRLLDAARSKLQDATVRLDGRQIVDNTRAGESGSSAVPPASYEGTAAWRPPIPGPGLYCVVVQMLRTAAEPSQSDDERELDHRTLWLAVLPPLEMPRHGDFGWTLPQGDRPLRFPDLARLLPQVGASWVKVPVWFDVDDPHRGDELIRFVELVGASHIEVVGVLDRPPPGQLGEAGAGGGEHLPVSELFALDESIWAPWLDPVMTRLAMRVRWWQLGHDHDGSFMGLPDLNQRIATLRNRLFRFGQEVQVGLAWDWSNRSQAPREVSWDFQQFFSEAPADEEDFEAFLAEPKQNTAQRWILVEPPHHGQEPEQWTMSALTERASQFVLRLVAAKQRGADAIFISNPFNNENGLMHEDCTPAEMLLPWRTTAAMLGGARYMGQLQLPDGSENRLFLRPDGQVAMVVWNEEPGEETLYLGEAIRQFNLWGENIGECSGSEVQTIRVGPAPSFVLGLHKHVARWRMSFRFEHDQVPSVFTMPHENALRLHNPFPQGVGGGYSIVVLHEHRESQPESAGEAAGLPGFLPDRWLIEPPRGDFSLAAGETAVIPLEIRLKNALFGRQPLRVDFDVEADQPYHFSVYTDMEVGTNDLTLEMNTHLDDDGTLVVEQLMSNHTESLADFRCNLYARGHRRKRMQVFRLGESVDRKVYRYPDGSDLIGQELLLEIEELNGPRVIKYHFVATETSDPEERSSEAAD